MANDVYTGFWVDWEYGRTRGATLTLPQTQGLIFVSFLTLFVQFSGACFWRVVCFILHQGRSTTSPRDGLFHQQQIILRNATTAPNALWNLGRSTLAWKGQVKSPFRHSAVLLLVTLIHMTFFGVAGLFSSQIASTGAGSALVKAGVCGYPKEIENLRSVEAYDLSGEDLITFNAEVLQGRLTITKSAAYARSCYNVQENGGSTDCNVFVQTYLEGAGAASENNATCPFGGGACSTPFAVKYDSGHISSNKHLGINFRPEEDLSIRRVTSCAPIDGEKYATDWKHNLPEAYGGKTNTSVKFWEFGRAKSNAGCQATKLESMTNDTTFCVSQYQKDYWQDAYTIHVSTAYAENPTASDFTPIADLQRDDADVTLISIYNQGEYTGIVDDPLFEAHKHAGRSPEFFTPTNDLSILGCTEQYQFCNGANSKCTDLTGLYSALHAVENGDLQLSMQQHAIFTVVWKAAWGMVLQWSATILDNSLLLAQDYVFTAKSRTSSKLPDTQWEREAHNLHNLSLAVLQRRVNEFSSPEKFDLRPGLSSLAQIDTPTDSYIERICHTQKTRSSTHVSVSVLGMCMILVVGSILIILDWTLIEQIFWFRSVTHLKQSKKADWKATGLLQLQRQALEARHVSPWNESDYLFPVLVERGRVFHGLAVRGEGAGHTPHEGSAYTAKMAYDGGTYSALTEEISMENVNDSKGRGV